MNPGSMSPKKRGVTIIVNCDDGTLKAEAEGYAGENCSVDINALLAGAEIKKRTPKIPQQRQAITGKQQT